jgi:nucleoside-diphosphate-sugar epimerase
MIDRKEGIPMKVFVTGATGFIGSAIVRELIEAGHQVLGLARSDAAAASLAAVGAEVHRGSLDDLDSLHNAAAASDGVIHTAFMHDFANFVRAAEMDLHAIETIGAALHLFRLALESAPAGSRLHGVAEEGVPVREIAGVIGRRLDVPVVSVPVEEAGEHFGFLGNFFSLDSPASSTLTQQRLGWHPVQPTLLADLDQEYYFKNER